MSVVLVSSDMMVSSRLRSTAQSAGVKVDVVAVPADLASRLGESSRLVFLDLMQPGLSVQDAVASARSAAPAARIIAFGPHVDEGLLAAARTAGCDVVMTNGQFHREHGAILARLKDD